MVEFVKHVLREWLAAGEREASRRVRAYHLQKEVGDAARARDTKVKKRRKYCQLCRAIVIASLSLAERWKRLAVEVRLLPSRLGIDSLSLTFEVTHSSSPQHTLRQIARYVQPLPSVS